MVSANCETGVCRHQSSCSRSEEAAMAEFFNCSRIALAVLWWHTSVTCQSHVVGPVSSRTKFLSRMHCFKSAADWSSQHCMKSNKPSVFPEKKIALVRVLPRNFTFDRKTFAFPQERGPNLFCNVAYVWVQQHIQWVNVKGGILNMYWEKLIFTEKSTIWFYVDFMVPKPKIILCN